MAFTLGIVEPGRFALPTSKQQQLVTVSGLPSGRRDAAILEDCVRASFLPRKAPRRGIITTFWFFFPPPGPLLMSRAEFSVQRWPPRYILLAAMRSILVIWQPPALLRLEGAAVGDV